MNMALNQLPPAGAWFKDLLAAVDAGELTPREAAVRVLTESTMLLGITIDHIAWELSAAVLRGDVERSRRFAEFYLYLADPARWRQPVAEAKAAPQSEPARAFTPEQQVDEFLTSLASDYVRTECGAGRTAALDDVRRALSTTIEQQIEHTLNTEQRSRLFEVIDMFIRRSADSLVAAGVRDDRSTRLRTGFYI
jgi:hypothetical protein